MCVPRRRSWLSLVFKSFDSSIVRRTHRPSEPPICVFAGDYHFTVPTSLMHADTLAPSSSLPSQSHPILPPDHPVFWTLDNPPRSHHWSRICLLATIFYVLTTRPHHPSSPSPRRRGPAPDHRYISRPPTPPIHAHPHHLHFPATSQPDDPPSRSHFVSEDDHCLLWTLHVCKSTHNLARLADLGEDSDLVWQYVDAPLLSPKASRLF